MQKNKGNVVIERREKSIEVHERRAETLLLSIIVLLLEGFVWFQFLNGSYSLVTTFFCHLLISIACAATIPLYTSYRADVRIVWLLTTAVTFLGPFGAGIAVLIIPGGILYRRFAPTSKDLLEEILPPVFEDASQMIVERSIIWTHTILLGFLWHFRM